VKLKITVEGKLYEVEVEVSDPELEGPNYYPPLHARMAAAPSPAPAAPKSRPTGPSVEDEGKVCRSPLAGTIARLNAQVGQTIQVNDVLLVLEAMKMETVITAPFAGKIKTISAQVGDAVAQGQVLVEIE
jgi:biotin carboxyl carrier protein